MFPVMQRYAQMVTWRVEKSGIGIMENQGQQIEKPVIKVIKYKDLVWLWVKIKDTNPNNHNPKFYMI